ncbi:MFS transporter [Epidermidibacterium keratini]|uniref:MFS transporter n=1 Tax=Epidermidibacterium keratini TaxID=1891644 RepID=A0A7L4YNC4_9ACTN|nr:MFS transporter [Epidermidibacterium keratini]QHC00578.1 MFS transporter [Epidermidibacterium keratini]
MATASPSRAASTASPHLIVLMLFAFMMVNFADKVVVGLAGPEIMRDMGIDAEQFGLAQGSFYWLFPVGAILGGYLVRRVHPRALLSGVALLWMLSLVPMMWTNDFGVLLATRLLLGFSEGPAMALATVVVHTWFTAERRTVPTSIVTAGAAVGPLVAAPVLSYFIAAHHWHTAFVVLGVVGALWVVAWLFIGDTGPHAASTLATAGAAELPPDLPARRVLRTGTYLGVVVLFFAAYCNVSVKTGWMPVYLREGLGYGPQEAARILAMSYAAVALAIVGLGWFSRRMTKRGKSSRIARGVVASTSVGVGGLATLALPQLPTGWLQVLMIMIAGAAASAGYGVAYAIVSDIAPVRVRGTVLGILVAAYSIAGALAPTLMGGMVDGAASVLAGFNQGLTVLGVVLLVGSIIGLLLINPERDVRRLSAAPAHATDSAAASAPAAPVSGA